MLRKPCGLALAIVVAVAGPNGRGFAAAEMSVSEAWQALPKYEYGQDMAALLAIDRAVIEAMATSEQRAACAARLAGLLADGHTTPAARQYICFQLRQVGTPAQVPVLAEMLRNAETAETARYALEQIPGDAASAALRKGLETLQGQSLVGVIDSLAVRKDEGSVPDLERLADDRDPEVASAAVDALGRIGSARSWAFVRARAEKSPAALTQSLAVGMLRQAQAMVEAGNVESAKAIFDRLSQIGQSRGIRRAALEGLLRLQGEQAGATILAWFTGQDPQRRVIAAGHLGALQHEQLTGLLTRLADLPERSRLAVVQTATARLGQAMLPVATSMVHGDKAELRLAGLQCLGILGDKSVIPLLLDQLSGDEPVREAAQDALARLPRADVVPALLESLPARPKVRPGVIGVLTLLHCREAIDSLIELAGQADPEVYGPALEGLNEIAAPHDALVSVIAAPDDTDVPRLVKLLLRTEPGRHRDKVERTIVTVCDKLPPEADRSKLVLDALAGIDRAELAKYLPLLGRLGGPQGLAIIQSSLGSTDAEVQAAAVRALCNWPNAEVAERLLTLATHSDNPTFRVWALRAYLRVVAMPSDRPESEILAMLQHAMTLAQRVDERRLAVSRAATVRRMETVAWIAPYLDDPELCQAACESLVELAHHRFLRQPNMDRFGPILEKVARLSKDPAVAERAERCRLGL